MDEQIKYNTHTWTHTQMHNGILFSLKRNIILLGTGGWLTPVILVTQEAEIRRIEIRSQPGQLSL
jgi:hypothetical protein